MRTLNRKNQLLIICLAIGFLIGIIYENLIAKKEVLMSDVFMKNNLKLYLNATIERAEYAMFLIKKRMLLFVAVGILGCIKWKRIFVILFLGFLGFCMGKLIVLSMIQLGIGGILMSIGSMAVHGIFYGLALAIMFSYWYQHPNGSWNYVKTIFVTFMLGCGMIVEIYVSPIVARWFIKIIC